MDNLLMRKKLCVASLLATLALGVPAAASENTYDFVHNASIPQNNENFVFKSGINRYFQPAILTKNEDTINEANGAITVIAVSDLPANPTHLLFDANLTENTSDSFVVSSPITSSTVKIDAINIISDQNSDENTLQIFEADNAPILDLNDYAQYTNNSKYTITNSTAAGAIDLKRKDISAGLKNAVADNSANRVFSGTANSELQSNLGVMNGTELTIFANSKDINGNGNSRITMGSSQTLTINNASDIHGFRDITASVISAVGGSIIIKDSTLSDNIAENWAGAVRTEGSDLAIYNTKFLNNAVNSKSSSSGGAIIANGATKIQDSLFSGNSVLMNTSDSTKSAYGGAIEAWVGSFGILGTTFESNAVRAVDAGNAFGGAIYLNSTSILSLYDSTFNNNTVESLNQTATGGAIYTVSTATASLNNTVFTNNRAKQGGAIYNAGDISVNNTIFENNTASDNGGAVYNTGTGIIASSIFKSNETTNTTGNSAGGGAVYNSGDLIISDSSFGTTDIADANIGAHGSAIFNTRNLVINKTLFENNTVTGWGAGTISNNNGGTVTVNNSIFKNLTTGWGGAAIHNENGLINIKNSEFSNAQTGRGGAIFSNGTLSVENSVFSNNQTDTPQETASAQSGAVYVASGSANFKNSSFVNNSTVGHSTIHGAGGGAIYNIGNTTITNSSFTGNSVSSGISAAGGAIYNTTGMLSVIADKGLTIFSGNKTNSTFNAIYLLSGTLNLNSGKNGYIKFDDSITSGHINNSINLNNTGVKGFDETTDAPENGMIILNETVSDSTINLYNGTLKLGDYNNDKTNNYFNNINLNLIGGTLNSANGNADTFNLNNFTGSSNASILIDADLGINKYDKFNVNGTSSGILNLGALNIISDLEANQNNLGDTRIDLFDSAKAPTITVAGNTYTNEYKYYINLSATNGALDIRQYDISDSIIRMSANASFPDKVFTSSTNLEISGNLGSLAGTSLTINGGGFDFNGAGHKLWTVGAGKTLILNNIGTVDEHGNILSSIHGFTDYINGYSSGSNIFINKVVASENSGVWAGFLEAGLDTIDNNTGILFVTDSTFYKNTALANGGSLWTCTKTYVDSTLFESNNTVALSGGNGLGGAIYGKDAYQIISNNIFKNNTARIGGAVMFNKGKTQYNTMNILGSTFISNSATANGGAVGIYNNVNISDSVFQSNTAGLGGAVYVTGSAMSTVTDSTFSNNSVTAGTDSSNLHVGGAIYNAGSLVVSGSTFTGNIANTLAAGGAIYNTGYLNVSDSIFNNNSSVAIYSPTGNVINIYASQFNNNFGIAASGGAIQSGRGSNIYSSTFIGNYTDLKGGVIDIWGQPSTIVDSIFKGNYTTASSLTSGGGAIYSSVTLNILGSIFGGSSAADGNKAAFTYGGAIYNDSVGNLLVTDSEFNNNTALAGSAIYNKGTLVVNSSSFKNNNATAFPGGSVFNHGGTATINNSVFESNTAVNQGGAVSNYTAGSIMVVNNSKFINNSAPIDAGGAIYQYVAGSLTVNNSYFSGNNSRHGGAVYSSEGISVNNSVFENNYTTNTGSDYGHGGAISGIGRVSNSVFKNNKALTFGGAIAGRYDITLSDFIDNQAVNSGGAYHAYSVGERTINASAFKGNKQTATGNEAYGGGAVYVSNTILHIFGSIFGGIGADEGNTAFNGGAIYVDPTSSVDVHGSKFINNIASAAGASGGAIYNKGNLTVDSSYFSGNGSTSTISNNGTASLTVTNSIFDSNIGRAIWNQSSGNVSISNSRFLNGTGTTSGAAIMLDAATAYSAAVVNVENSIFKNNTSTSYGAAINNGAQLTIKNSIFESNIVADKGGGVIVTDDLDSGTNISGSVFKNNSASYGGAIYNTLQTATTTISNSIFLGNYATTGDNNLGGGAIYNSADINLSGVKFDSNYAQKSGGALKNNGTATVTYGLFSNNMAKNGNGGAIDTVAGSTTTINSSSFINNSASNTDAARNEDDGGAINSRSTLTINNSYFGNNSVNSAGTGANGGAIWQAGDGLLTINYSDFANNTTPKNHGSAISLHSNANIMGSSFSGNVAAFEGTIYLDTAKTLNLDSSAFYNNTASQGGAIYNDTGATVVVNNSVFNGNIATRTGFSLGGGAIQNMGTATINRSLFIGNTTKGTAGAINNQSVMTITDSFFKNNSADSVGGGAIYNDYDETLNIKNTSFKANSSTTQAQVYSDAGSTLNIAADAGIVSFKDFSKALRLYNDSRSTNLNLNTTNGGLMVITGTIDNSGARRSIININNSNTAWGYTDTTYGNVIFNGLISGMDINLYGGMTYLSGWGNAILLANTTLNVMPSSGGNRLSLANGVIDALGSTNVAALTAGSGVMMGVYLDADLAASQIDKITPGTTTGTSIFAPRGVNIIADGGSKNMNFGMPVAMDGATNTYTNNYKYLIGASGTNIYFTQNSGGGLLNALNDTTANRAFSLTSDYTAPAYGSKTLAGGSGVNFVIYGNNHGMNANGNNSVFVVSGQQLTVQGVGQYDKTTGTVISSWNDSVVRTDGYGLIENAGNVNLFDSVFANNSSRDGSVLYNSANGLLNINNSVFVNNSGTGNSGALELGVSSKAAYIADSIFKSNTAGIYGGAIYSLEKLAITGSDFSSNSTIKNGGAIYSSSGVNITDTTFTDNKQTAIADGYGGGAISLHGGTTYITASTFRNNSGRTGGAIYNAAGSTAYINGSEFYGNKTITNGTALGGGAIFNAGTMTIIGSTFDGNTCPQDGGAIDNNGNLTIIKSDFINNGTANGTAIYSLAGGTASLTVVDSYFGQNSGSAIWGGFNMNITGSVFEDNSQAILNSYYEMKVNASEFYNNGTNSAHGGAINVSDKTSYAVISNSTFGGTEANKGNFALHGGAINVAGASSKLTIYNSDFLYNYTTGTDGGAQGGAIYNAGTAIIVNSYFEGNSTFASSGASSGAIQNKTGAQLTISGTDFAKNAASTGGAIENWGGTLKISSSNFSENTAKTGYGGAISNGNNGTAEISTSTFTGNKANSSNGGAINNFATMTINNSTFGGTVAGDGNTASYGGAIYNATNTSEGVLSEAVLTINNSDFIKNTASYGGAIGNLADSTVNVYGSTFDGNSSKGGGAIRNKGTFNIDGTTFINNSSKFVSTTDYGGDGGAIDSSGVMTIKNSYFENNKAISSSLSNDGGAIIAGTSSITKIYNTIFNGNAAENGCGGAIWNYGDMTINGSTFTSNTSTYGGGALWHTTNTALLNLSNSKFLGNRTVDYGGAIGTNGSGGITISSSIFGGTGADEGNTAKIGGALYLFNTATTISSSQFINNTALDGGGAIGNNGTAATTITGSVFKSNKVTGSTYGGGAIYNSNNNGKLTITDSAFGGAARAEGNTAVKNGGAISNNTTLSVTNTEFNNNVTGESGGAIYNILTATIGNSVFKNNEALQGGAVGNLGGTATITNSTFENNTSKGTVYGGGAIYNEAVVNISNSVFSSNTSATNGGAILNTKTMIITDSVFKDNYAESSGAAISQRGSGTLTTIKNSVFKDNTTTVNGAVHADASSVLKLIAEQGKSILFSGNKTIGTVSRTNNVAAGAIVLSGATADVSLAKGGSLIFENNSSFSANTSYAALGGALSLYRNASVNPSMDINAVQGSLIEFKNNTASMGGAIYSAGTINANVDVIRFSGNKAVSANGINRTGGAIYNAGTFNLNANKAEFINNSADANGGAIANYGTMSVSNGYFKGNTAVLGGAVFNDSGAKIVISDSIFENNSASGGSGGAIDNRGTATVINTVFKNNSLGFDMGGAFTNRGTFNLIANNGISMVSGNTSVGNPQSGISNYGTLNLAAGNNGKIIIDDRVGSAGTDININKSGIKLADGITDAATDGEIVFNNVVVWSNINLYNGTLTLNKESDFVAGDTSHKLNLNLEGGVFNLINNKIGTVTINDFSSKSGSKLNIDADLTSGANSYGNSDSITVNGTVAAGSTIALNAVNILKDGDAEHLTIFNNTKSPSITTTATYTNGGYKYTFTQNADIAGVVDVVKGEAQPATSLSTAGFIAAIKDTTANRAFSATGDVDVREDLPSMAGTNLSIFGNQHNINGNGNKGLIVSSGKVLNIYNVGLMNSDGTVKTAWNGFNNTNGSEGSILNNGTVNIHNSVFNNNKTDGSGGAIRNNSDLNIYDSYFINSSGATGGALSSQGGNLNLVNVTFASNTNNALDLFGGANVNIINSTFKDNKSAVSIMQNSDVYFAGTTFVNNNSTKGGAISNSGGSFAVESSVFEKNNAVTAGGAIHNSSAQELMISDTKFTKNTAADGGAISNDTGSTTTIVNSEFTSNISTGVGSAISSKGTLNVENSLFENNSGMGGTIYATDGTMNIRNTVFKNNTSAAIGGGAILTSGAVTINMFAENGGTLAFVGNKAQSSPSYQNLTWGGAIDNAWASNLHLTAQKASNIIFENNKAIANSGYTSFGGAIYNGVAAGTEAHIIGASGSNIVFKGNSADEGGAIYNNTNVFDINVDSIEFSANTAKSGAAIYNNAAEFTLIGNNVKFKNNTAQTNGGAIFNHNGIINLMTDHGTISFSGNKVRDFTNAIYNEDGTINLNAGKFGQIIFNDKISSNNITNEININQSGTITVDGTPVNRTVGGEIIFKDTVSNSTINLFSGILTLGAESNLNGGNLNLSGGKLNLANNKIGEMTLNSFTASNGAKIDFDADLNSGASDSINVSAISGDLTVNGINVIKDGIASKLTLFKNMVSPTLTALKTFTNDAVYSFSPSSTAGVIDVTKTLNASAGLPAAIADTTKTRAFSATSDVTVNIDLGVMGGTDSTLTIFGNKHNINGDGHQGFDVGAGNTLNVFNVGSLNDDGTVKTSWNGFVHGVGGVLNNFGTTNITESVFSNNKATTGSGGALKNKGGELNIADSVFMNNESSDGAAISNQLGKTTIVNSRVESNTSLNGSGGIVNYETPDQDNSTTLLDITSSVFAKNIGVSGGAIKNNEVALKVTTTEFTENESSIGGALYNAGNAEVNDSDFENNDASLNGGAIYNINKAAIKSSTFKGNTALSKGGAIFNLGKADITDSHFDKNNTADKGAAIYNESGTLTIADSEFKNNIAENYGGAIYNYGGTANISGTTFEGNKSGADGGAIFNSTDLTIENSIFISNAANTNSNNGQGGAIVHNAGLLTLQNSLFEKNTAHRGGAMYIGGTSTITGTTFKDNKSELYGGAIAVFNAQINLENSKFIGNTAEAGYGGAIASSGNVSLNSVVFENNEAKGADSYGGAIVMNKAYSKGNLTVSGNSSFNNNKAEGKGGAVFSDSVINIIADTDEISFIDNTAALGNDIYLSDGTLNVSGSANTIINGGIAGTAGSRINKSQEGVLNLRGQNTDFLGTTVISGGNILFSKIDEGGKITDTYLGGTTKIDTNGTLEFNISESKTYALNGYVESAAEKSGNFLKTGAGTVVMNADNSRFNGTATIDKGNIVFNKNELTDKYFTGSTLINTNGTLEFNLAQDDTFTTVLSGNGNFVKNGQKTLTISGNNRVFAGITSINAGKISFNKTQNSDEYFAGKTEVAAGAALEFDTDINTFAHPNVYGAGTFIKTGSADLELNGDNSGFEGIVTVNEGTLKFSTGLDKKFFNATEINVFDTFEYNFNENGTFDENVNLKGNANLNLNALGSSYVTVGTSPVSYGSNNTVNYSNGTFIFADAMSAFRGSDNKLNFNNTTLMVSDTLDSFGHNELNAEALDTHIDLRNGKTGTLNFGDLKFSGSNNMLSVDIDLKDNKNQLVPSTDKPSYDKIIAESGSGTVSVGNIAIIKDGEWANEILKIVDAGSITINDFNNFKSYTSGGYVYDITKSAQDGGSIVLSTVDYNLTETLKKAHNAVGDRSFTVNDIDSYKVLSNLGDMGKDSFTVNGALDSNGNIIRTITGNNLWELFNVDSSDGQTRSLNINNIIITKAKTNLHDDGSAIHIEGPDSTVTLSNTVFKDNIASVNGGAAYNKGGKLIVNGSEFSSNNSQNGAAVYNSGVLNSSGSVFKSNTASQNGGALYNAADGISNIENTVFSGNSAKYGGAVYNEGTLNFITQNGNAVTFINNSANGAANDIYNNGNIFVKGEGSVNINSGLAGNGILYVDEKGTLNLKGNNSDFLGTANINEGNVIFRYSSADDTYLGGQTVIAEKGRLEYNMAVDGILTGNQKISGTGVFAKTGSGNLTVNGQNDSFTGLVSIEEGVLNYIQSQPDGTYFGGITEISLGAILNYTNTADDILNSVKGYGTFNKYGIGNVEIIGDNSVFNGVTNIYDGTVTYNKTDENENFVNGIVNIKSSLVFNLSKDEIIGGNLKGSDGATITKTGNSTLNLINDNSVYSGSVIIDGGAISFDVTSTSDKYFNGQTTINQNGRLIFNIGEDTTFNGTNNIIGDGIFEKTGDQILNVTGKNDAFKNIVEINDGTLSYVHSDGGSYFGGKTSVATSATLEYSVGNGYSDNIHGLIGDGILNKIGTGVVNLDKDSSAFDGIINVEEGKLSYNHYNNDDKYIIGTTNVTDGAELNFNITDTDTISGTILGGSSSTISKTDSGTLIIKGTYNDFHGQLNIESGTIRYQESLGSSYINGNTQISQDATLIFDNTGIEDIQNISSKTDGAGSFIKEGTGTLNLKGDNSNYSGSVDVNGGKLVFDDAADKFFGSDLVSVNGQTGSASLVYNANAAASFDTAVNLVDNGNFTLNGSGSNIINISNNITASGSSNTVEFNNGQFVFDNNFSEFGKRGTSNTIFYSDSVFKLGNGISEFGSDKLNASFIDTTIDLRNDRSDKLIFNNLDFNGENNKLQINLDLKGNGNQGHPTTDSPESDMIKYNSGSGSIEIDNISISQNGQWKDAEIQILDGNGDVSLKAFDSIAAATSSEYEYSIENSSIAGHETSHIQISTTDYIADPTGENFSLKKMHTRIDSQGGNVSSTRIFTVDTQTPLYRILSNLDEMGDGKFTVNGQGKDKSTISGNGLWTMFNADSSDGKNRELNINDVKISDSQINADSGRTDGAALNITGEKSIVTVNNTAFDKNIAVNAGGAIHNNGGKLTVQNTDFTDNIAGTFGGAINNIANPVDFAANISNSTFTSNTALNAGAVNNAADMTIKNAVFTTNTASNDAGAVLNSSELNVNNAFFEKNTAQNNGGAVNNTGNLTLTDVSFNQNNAFLGNGGAIYNTGSLVITADKADVIFTNNTANGHSNDIYNNGDVTVKGEKDTNILSGISGNGILTKEDEGTLNIKGENKDYSGNVTVNGGMLVYHKETDADSFFGGKVTVNDDTKLAFNTKVDEVLNGNVKGSGTFVKAGEAVLTLKGDNTEFLGLADIQTGKMVYVQTDTDKYFGGSTHIFEGAELNYTNANEDTVKDFSGNGSIVKNGAGKLNLTGKNDEFIGKTTVNDGSLNYEQTTDSRFFGGSTEIAENAELRFTSDNDGSNNVENVKNLSGKGSFVKDGEGTVSLKGSNGNFEGHTIIENGKLKFVKQLNKDAYLKGVTTINENGELEFSLRRDENLNAEIKGTGTFTKTGDSVLSLSNDNSGFKGTVELKEGTIALGKDYKFFDHGNFNIYNGTLFDMRNAQIDIVNLGNLTLNGNSNLGLDLDLKARTGDFITSESVHGDGGLNIKYLNILKDGYYKDTYVSVADIKNGLSDKISLDNGLSRVMGPIYQYQVDYNKTTGQLHFIGGELLADSMYNPAVLMPVAAAQIGGYLTQLNSYDEAFANMDMLMLLPRAEREAMRHRNKYAAADSNIAFTPTMIPEQNRGNWFRPFSTFESVPLAHGPKVSNVAYGALVGTDSEIISLKHGVEAVFSAYAGYNGSNQTALGTKIYQNGGVAGLTGVFYKGNFFSGITANAGASAAELSTMYGRDDFTMFMAGIASKSGYNWELFNGKFVIQPNYMMSYTFVNTFDYTNKANVRIHSEPLNAIQVAPGIKFIGNLKNGWQPYASVQVVMNFMDKAKFHANDVSLPEMSVKPFVSYGVGVQKRWGDRFTGFFQTMLRSGGRNGVGFQLGLRWSI